MSDVRIQIRDDGPFLVQGQITLVDADGNEFPNLSEKPAIALCRCGASKNRPFCDGSHKECGFDSKDRAT